jgi:HEAT repeat protein
MPKQRNRRKKFAIICLGLLALGAGIAWWQRTALQCWYYAYRMQGAGAEQRQVWAEQLADLGELAVPRLLACLTKDDEGLCDAARVGLERLARTWQPADGRGRELARRLFEENAAFSPAGKAAALELVPALINANGPEAAARLKRFVVASLQSAAPAERLAAVGVALRPEINLLEGVVPLLNDPVPEVRRAAMLALGPVADNAEPLISSDQLLRWLHDPDAEVQRSCEMALRGRGLSARDIHLGRLLSHPDPVERLSVLIELPRDDDFALVKWLERLSKDPNSAVRAGAARVAGERGADFLERLDEMSHTDPDSTVRRIAEHYRKLCAEQPR